MRGLRIAYLVERVALSKGVDNKVRDHLTAWEAQGMATRLFELTDYPEGSTWPGVSVIQYRGRAGKPAAARELASRVADYQPDVVYTRGLQCLPGYFKLTASFPVVVEINADALRELRLTAPRTYCYERLTQGLILPRAAGFVCVTGELAGLPQYAGSGKPVAVISNGISLASLPEVPAPANPQPRLVFIGAAGQAWHGVDKIIWLAERFPAWSFDLVGVARDALATPPANVTLHGVLGPRDYGPLMRQADVALGTMALHRKGIDELCSLKHREYAACGLPIIMGAYDTDLSGVPGVLQLPNTERNVMNCVDRIEQFVHWCRGRRISRDDIQHMDSAYKEARRLQFLQQVAGLA